MPSTMTYQLRPKAYKFGRNNKKSYSFLERDFLFLSRLVIRSGKNQKLEQRYFIRLFGYNNPSCAIGLRTRSGIITSLEIKWIIGSAMR